MIQNGDWNHCLGTVWQKQSDRCAKADCLVAGDAIVLPEMLIAVLHESVPDEDTAAGCDLEPVGASAFVPMAQQLSLSPLSREA